MQIRAAVVRVSSNMIFNVLSRAAAVALFLLPASVFAAPDATFTKLMSWVQAVRSGGSIPEESVVEVSVDKLVVSSSDVFTLSWYATGSSSCAAEGAWTGALSVSGSLSLQSYGVGERTFAVTCITYQGEIVSEAVSVLFVLNEQQKQVQSAVSAIFATF
jgi:hypothetical protein